MTKVLPKLEGCRKTKNWGYPNAKVCEGCSHVDRRIFLGIPYAACKLSGMMTLHSLKQMVQLYGVDTDVR